MIAAMTIASVSARRAPLYRAMSRYFAPRRPFLPTIDYRQLSAYGLAMCGRSSALGLNRYKLILVTMTSFSAYHRTACFPP